MGAQPSKPGNETPHVFTSDTPVQFSPSLLHTLEASTQTNSTRTKDLELYIQKKVAEELERVRRHEDEKLKDVREMIAAEGAAAAPSPTTSETVVEKVKGKLAEHNPLQAAHSSGKENSTQSVQAEIQRLQHTLSARKQVRALEGEVKEARDEVVRCLRGNDRRPLDCWREVQIFKNAVGGMEERFVGNII